MWCRPLSRLLLLALTIPFGYAEPPLNQVRLPIEVLGADGTIASRTVFLSAAQSESVHSLWLQAHGLRYPEQGSVQINASPWIPLDNNTVTVAEPGRTFGGIGGGFASLAMTLPLPPGAFGAGANTIRFRFNRTDGLASGYRVLEVNLLTREGGKVLLADDFVEDAPERWTPPLPDAASIQSGEELWRSASLVASGLKGSPQIRAHCADCHAQDGRDLKYFNFSNASIIARSRFHGLTALQGEQIASYIRSLAAPNPGRPWNPPYQPGPGTDQKPISEWSAGAGLSWALDKDTDALVYLLDEKARHSLGSSELHSGGLESQQLLRHITPGLFRPDGNLNPREVPITLQLPDWSQWLPRIHPKDAWGVAFDNAEFAAMYDGGTGRGASPRHGPSLRALLSEPQTRNQNIRAVVPAFARWTQSRRIFFGHMVKVKTAWSSALTSKVYSTQLWQLVKTWEMMQEFGLEARGRELVALNAESRTWCNTVPAESAPSSARIPNGPAGVGGSALTNEYLSAAWYELQIVLNSGNHSRRDRDPVDWIYVIGQFRNLYALSDYPEPVRLLVAVTKAMQSSDPRLGPDNYSQGWRPDQNIDPRIMISANWMYAFKPFSPEIRRALAESLLAAWMDKTESYPLTKYLPILSLKYDYTPRYEYMDISGGRVWEALGEFRASGISGDLLDRVRNWGLAYVDRAARLQYH